jgi:hypothetical protein
MDVPAQNKSFPVLCGSLNIPKSKNDLANKFTKSKQMLNFFQFITFAKKGIFS